MMMLGGSFAEPALAALRRKRLFVRRKLRGRPDHPRPRLRTAEEVRLDHRDPAAAELEVAMPGALVGRLGGLGPVQL